MIQSFGEHGILLGGGELRYPCCGVRVWGWPKWCGRDQGVPSLVSKEVSSPHVCIAICSFIAFHPCVGRNFFDLYRGDNRKYFPILGKESNKLDMCSGMRDSLKNVHTVLRVSSYQYRDEGRVTYEIIEKFD